MVAIIPSMPDIIARLDQRTVIKGQRSFAIQNDGKVVATYSEPGFRKELTLELSGINLNGSREKHVATGMIVGMCIFLIPTLGFLWATITTRFGSEAFFLVCWSRIAISAACGAVLAGICSPEL